MDKVSGEGSFQIILQSDGIEDFSDEWQNQCEYFYNEFDRALPKGTIKPLALEAPAGGRVIDINSFSHIIVDEFAAKIIASTIVEALFVAFKNWSEYRPKANIKLRYPDGSIVRVSNKFFLELLEYSKENSQLSVFQVLNHLKDFKE
jgi:hypothetical protein